MGIGVCRKLDDAGTGEALGTDPPTPHALKVASAFTLIQDISFIESLTVTSENRRNGHGTRPLNEDTHVAEKIR